jgi:hypothetical protein
MSTVSAMAPESARGLPGDLPRFLALHGDRAIGGLRSGSEGRDDD